MAAQFFELAILLSLKDAASGGLDRIEDKLRATGKEGRQTLQTFQDLRKDFRQGLQLAGIGVTELMMLRSGVKTAGDFEASMADLRLSIQELGNDGRVNMTKLGDEMNRFENLGMQLGNKLPGTTEDFIQMFSTLKQGGLATQTILDGTGEAVAHLAVVTGAVPKDLAQPFAQYAQQFQLTGEEARKLADTMARLKFSTGLDPQELIEGSKFFQLRAGAPLGLTGLEGAEQGGRLLAVLRSFGLEGGIGGRELGGFVSHLTFSTKEQQEALAQLRKQYGITLDIFDQKTGKFKGFDNLFVQMEKLRKLNQKDFLELGGKLFTAEGVAPATVMMKAGANGWDEINARINKTPPLQDAVNQKVDTYNAKLESVIGTLENLKATAFTPALDQLKPLLDDANEIAGAIQSFAKAHPDLAKTLFDLIALQAGVMTVVGGFKAMRAAYGLWRIASAVGAGEQGLLNFLRGTGTEATGAATKVGGLRGALGSLPKTVQVTLLLASIGYTIHEVKELLDAIDAFNKSQPGWQKTGQQETRALTHHEQAMAQAGRQVDPAEYQATALNALRALNVEGHAFDDWLKDYGLPGSNKAMFVNQAKGEGEGLAALGKLGSLWLNMTAGNIPGLFSEKYRVPLLPNFFQMSASDPRERAAFMQQRAPQLANPNVMAAFRGQIQDMKLGPSVTQTINQWLSQAFPDSFVKSSQMLTSNMEGLATSTGETAKGFNDLRQPLIKLPPDLNRAGDAAQRFADRIDNLNFSSPTVGPGSPIPGVLGGPTSGPSTAPSLSLPPLLNPPPRSPALRSSLSPERGRSFIEPSVVRNLVASIPINVRAESGASAPRINKRTNINVYATPGMTEAALVDRMFREVERREARS